MFYSWNLKQYVTYVLLTLVFISSWTDINGIYVELPQIILVQPESWKLGANLVLVTNLGNIAPFTLVFIKCLFPKRTLNTVPMNYVVIIIGMISCFLLIFFWSHTTMLFDESRSTALLTLAFFLSLLDCTSSVSFADYLHRFKKEFTNTLFLGESLTFIVPSLLAMAQGNGIIHCVKKDNETEKFEPVYESPRFSVSIYFLCLFILLTISLVSFVLLQWTSIAHGAQQIESETSVKVVDTIDEQYKSLTKLTYILLLVVCAYISSILFGIIISISTYVLMPYGHGIFYLGTVLSPWTFTIVWLCGTMKPIVFKRYILLFVLLGSLTFAFIMYAAFKSPCSPWIDTTKGNIYILTIWLGTYALLGYPRVAIANYVRTYSPNGMFWFGASVQLGGLAGSIVAYLMADTFALLKERAACTPNTCSTEHF